jgi:hypothetical protein
VEWIDRSEWERARAYLADLRDRMGLRDWTVRLEHGPAEDGDCMASVRPIEGRRHATVWLSRSWADLTADAKRHALVHELLHCHHAPAADVVRLACGRTMGQPAYDVLFSAFRNAEEYAVDGLADVLAPLMPQYPG